MAVHRARPLPHVLGWHGLADPPAPLLTTDDIANPITDE